MSGAIRLLPQNAFMASIGTHFLLYSSGYTEFLEGEGQIYISQNALETPKFHNDASHCNTSNTVQWLQVHTATMEVPSV